MTAVVFPAMLLMLRFSLNGGTKGEEMDGENGMSRFELRLYTMLEMEGWSTAGTRVSFSLTTSTHFQRKVQPPDTKLHAEWQCSVKGGELKHGCRPPRKHPFKDPSLLL